MTLSTVKFDDSS